MNERSDPQLPPDCEKVMRALWEYLDHAIEPNSVAEIEEHLERCGYCQAHADFEQTLCDRLREIRKEHSNPSELRARVHEALRSAGLGG